MPKFRPQEALQAILLAKMCSYSSEGEKREIWGILDGFEIWARCGVWWLRTDENETGMITDEISAVYE